MKTKIVVNKIKCNHCGDEIESTHVHDFKMCSCGFVSVDGGHSYLKRSVMYSMDDYTELSICEEIDENEEEHKE